jgi:hypothetical protein
MCFGSVISLFEDVANLAEGLLREREMEQKEGVVHHSV